MPWVKIPQENHPLFHDCLPRDPRVSTVKMFGGVAAKANGQMFAGLFARGAIVKLSPDDQRRALAIDGAGPFDPMQDGRVMRDTIFLPESVLEDRDGLRAWLRKGLEYTASLAPKKARAKPAANEATTKAVTKKPAAKKPAAKKPAAKKPVAAKPAAKKPTARKARS